MSSYEKELQLHLINKIPAFEGWYFRVVDNKISIAVIIGIAKTSEKQEAFIQVFHTLSQKSERVSFDIEEFHYQDVPFMINIKNIILKKHYVHIEDENLSVLIDLEINMPKYIKKSLYAPTIMGPFAYFKNMQCNHAITNLKSYTKGYIDYLDKRYYINGTIYQEKDWGTSFPTKYIWVQSHCCHEKRAILFLSCATIPLNKIGFTGIIMTLIIDDKEFHIASYYGAYIVKAKKMGNSYILIIRQGRYLIKCYLRMGPTYILDAPREGQMTRQIEESLLGYTIIKIYKYKKCIETLTFDNCGIENDHFFTV
ncbi:MAG: tocopherol cyclase family protein [Coprobacillus sp.]